MTDLETALRVRFTLLPEPDLMPPAGLAERLRRRHDWRRRVAPAGVAAGVAAAAGASVLLVARPGESPATLTPAIQATTMPTPSAVLTRQLEIAGLNFTLPAELHVAPPVQGISQDVTRHDHSTAAGPSFITDVGLVDGRRTLSISVYEGRAAAPGMELGFGDTERPVLVGRYQGRQATTVSEIPPGVSDEMRRKLSRPLAQLFVRLSAQQTLLLTSTGFTTGELVAIAQTALSVAP